MASLLSTVRQHTSKRPPALRPMCKALKPLGRPRADARLRAVLGCGRPPPGQEDGPRGEHTRERIVADEAKDFGFENKLMFAELKRLVYLCPK